VAEPISAAGGGARWPPALGRRRAVTLGLLAIGALSCGQTDPVGEAIQSAKDRSVPPGGRLIPLYGPARDEESVKASWEVETRMAWDVYAAWVVSQMPEFRVRQKDGDVLSLSRPLDADVYALSSRPKEADKSAKVEVAFEARPF
jgi:hypothetical protein